MADAWAAARRFVAVIAVALLLTAILEVAENAVHIESGFLHLIVFPISLLVAVVLVHGFRIFERVGF